MIKDLVDGTITPGCDPTPDLAANIVFELHKSATGDKKSESSYSVKMMYNSKPVDFCLLMNDKDQYVCPFDKFAAKIGEMTNSRYMEWCVNGEDDESYEESLAMWKTISLILTILFVGLMIGCVLTSVKLYKTIKPVDRISQSINIPDQNDTLGQNGTDGRF